MMLAIALLLAAAPKPLFAGDEPIRVTIRGPIVDVARSGPDSRKERAATLQMPGETALPIRLSPRGLTRRQRDVCQFAPLRVEFAAPPPPQSLFAGQGRLKLVTHCRASAEFQKHLLLEYSAYRMFNLLTPLSFRARLAAIDYVDAAGRPIASRYGFFIEDAGDVAARNGGREAQVGTRVPPSQLVPADAARFALFQYWIGNHDWSMRAGPPGERCCHNSRLIQAAGSPMLTPVPYDFDFSGMVDAPYARPPAELPLPSVRTRRYRGYCMHNAQALRAAAEMRGEGRAMLAVLGRVPGLDPGARAKASAYLEQGLGDLAGDRFLKTCL